MATLIIKDQKIYIGGYDLTGDLRAVRLGVSVDAQEHAVLGSNTRPKAAGLVDVSAEHEGFWQGGTGLVDDVLHAKYTSDNEVVTLAPTTGADGELAYFCRMLHNTYEPGAAVGEMFGFNVSAVGADGPLVRGTILHPKTARSTTGNGTARQLGAVSATQKLYAALHVVAVSGGGTPSLTVKVQSGTSGAMSSPVDRITFAAANAVGSQWGSANGPITETWFRVSWTITGTTPSFTFICAVGAL